MLGEARCPRSKPSADRSLVAREPDGRFRLYASVRQFAAEHAARRGEDTPAAHRHAHHFAARATRELDAGRRSDHATRRLLDVLGDLEAAHEDQDADPALRRALLLGIASARIGRVASTELVGRLDDARRAASDDPTSGPTAVATLHALRGRALEAAGRVEEAIASYERAHTMTPDGAKDELGRRLAELAHAELARGDVARASRAATQSPPRRCAVRARRVVGLVAQARGQLDEAREAYVGALDLAQELALPDEAAGLRADLGALRLQQRRLEEAREAYDAALADLDGELDPIKLGLAEGNLAILEQEEGRVAQAAALYARAIERLQRAGHRLYTAHLLVYSGALAHERGALEIACARYQAARSSLRRVGDARLLAIASALSGAAEATRGRHDAAEESFDESARALARVDDSGVEAAVRAHRAHLRLTEDPSRALALLAELEGAAILGASDDARLAVRLLRQRLGQRCLTVDEGARRWVLPDGTDVDLSSRLVLWRLVTALLALREDSPGRPLSVDAAIDAGWPGERMTGESAQNRLKVALSTLRKLGLRELLVRHDSGGYLLDPSVPVVRASK
ncbi:MAG: tetratricopeptide repeat protein [Myxococcales bacterium]|nr:tetratricopeptide repeat protein [Myxococcales bacterium]